MIQLNNITAQYGQGDVKTTALKDVTLSIPDDIVCSIMGKSGSGKTTLLNVIGSLMPPVSGEVYIDEQNIYAKSDRDKCLFRRQRIGFVYQSYDLLPELTAYENIVLPLMLDKQKPNTSDVISLCKEIGIDHLLKKHPTQMSGGEQQRVAIARAVIHKPKLLLCDEPTGNLDENTANIIIDTIKKLQKELSTTVIIVTHDIDIAEKTDRIIKIHDGSLLEV